MKALPGTKQGARQWFKESTGWFIANGYKQLVAEDCIFVKGNIILVVYVDDITIYAKTWTETEDAVRMMRDRYNLVDNGATKEFLQMQIESKEGYASINQHKYIMKKAKDQRHMQHLCLHQLSASNSKSQSPGENRMEV